MAVDSGLIHILQGHKGGGMQCGAKTVILWFTFFFPSSCAESTYSHVTETSLVQVFPDGRTYKHSITFIVHNVFYCCMMCI
jgi:hypothetical protein